MEDSGAAVVSGVGEEFPSLHSLFDPTVSLSLTIGNVVFDDPDDIEAGIFSDIPSLVFQDGSFQGMDFVVLFTIDVRQQRDREALSPD